MKTDTQEGLRAKLDACKSFPAFPQGERDLGWAPEGEKYTVFLRTLAQALDTYNDELAGVTLQLREDPDTKDGDLRIGQGHPLQPLARHLCAAHCSG